jgi:hypothetical protein
VKSGKVDTWTPRLVTYETRFQKTVKKSTLGIYGAQWGLKLRLASHLLLIRVRPVPFYFVSAFDQSLLLLCVL